MILLRESVETYVDRANRENYPKHREAVVFRSDDVSFDFLFETVAGVCLKAGIKNKVVENFLLKAATQIQPVRTESLINLDAYKDGRGFIILSDVDRALRNEQTGNIAFSVFVNICAQGLRKGGYGESEIPRMIANGIEKFLIA